MPRRLLLLPFFFCGGDFYLDTRGGGGGATLFLAPILEERRECSNGIQVFKFGVRERKTSEKE